MRNRERDTERWWQRARRRLGRRPEGRFLLAPLAAVALAGACRGGDAGSVGHLKPVTTPSGLAYQDQRLGTGEPIRAGQVARVHYSGWLDDNGKLGRRFDSSYERNEPYEFKLGAREVIAGWDEGIAGMKVGGRRRLTVPASLAYGARGAGNGTIPPNATLIFDVELLEIR